MEFDPPIWYLNQPCPCCLQQSLMFFTCPTCGLAVLICDDINTVVSISGLRCGPVIGGPMPSVTRGTCQKCGESEYSTFRASTSDEIRALGFQYGDYT